MIILFSQPKSWQRADLNILLLSVWNCSFLKTRVKEQLELLEWLPGDLEAIPSLLRVGVRQSLQCVENL